MSDEIDWSEIPVDVTHYCKERGMWYRRHPSGEWQYREPFNNFDWKRSIITENHAESLIARPVEPTTVSSRSTLKDDKLVREAIAAGVRRLMPAEKEAGSKPRPTYEELVLEIGRLTHEKCHLEAMVDDFQRQVEMLFSTQNRLVEQLTDSLTATPGYERLVAVLKAAHDQAAMGKGADRHANGLPFHKQRMQQISVLLDSPYGMAYQVAKKVAEGVDLPTHDRQVAELYGAINYIAGIVIFLEDKLAGGDE